ncbi:MAG: YihY/virulence factor BrkB family protein, partial [Cytophagales bacterium]|nr:YihY/virulence factor BrkB family protein [Cytophagales bacterium]
MSVFSALILQGVRIVVMSARNFEKNECFMKASALTFLSALSIVPLVGIVFGISSGLGLDIKGQILSFLQGQEFVMQQAFHYAEELLNKTREDLITGIGILVLFYTVMQLLHNIEEIFNGIWNIRQPRNLQRKVSDYTSILLLSPLLVFFSSSLTVYVSGEVQTLAQDFSLLGYFAPLITGLVKFLPYTLSWILVSLLYMIMPNTRVRIRSALISGIIAGTSVQIVQAAYINFQIGVSQYNAIYGSLAAVPLFLVWIKTSWLIVLFGAEVAYSHQNLDQGGFEEKADIKISWQEKKRISLIILYQLIDSFQKGEMESLHSLSRKTYLPRYLIKSRLEKLIYSRLVSEVRGKQNEVFYQPARDVQTLTLNFVMKSLETQGVNDICEKNQALYLKRVEYLSELPYQDLKEGQKPLVEI